MQIYWKGVSPHILWTLAGSDLAASRNYILYEPSGWRLYFKIHLALFTRLAPNCRFDRGDLPSKEIGVSYIFRFLSIVDTVDYCAYAYNRRILIILIGAEASGEVSSVESVELRVDHIEVMSE
ncbi:hypothetical protein [Paenibacillus sp. EZ-K15]|uniref:hypothetical protein n=1 Tax=Paenibacillus sp. EZ-K15 TaxID=2044275 RepID=UPI00129053FC|nr:hypothetical protein [Paenibacillus sp. EZ-K15]